MDKLIGHEGKLISLSPTDNKCWLFFYYMPQNGIFPMKTSENYKNLAVRRGFGVFACEVIMTLRVKQVV